MTHRRLMLFSSGCRPAALLPETHLADAGYVNGLTIQSSSGYGVNLLGPISADTYGTSRKDVKKEGLPFRSIYR